MSDIKIKGELIIDSKGIIWFNSEKGECRLRIQDMPVEIVRPFFECPIHKNSLINDICRKCGWNSSQLDINLRSFNAEYKNYSYARFPKK